MELYEDILLFITNNTTAANVSIEKRIINEPLSYQGKFKIVPENYEEFSDDLLTAIARFKDSEYNFDIKLIVEFEVLH